MPGGRGEGEEMKAGWKAKAVRETNWCPDGKND